MKYIITQEMLNYIESVGVAVTYKSIEPLSDEQICKVLRDIGAASIEALDFRTAQGQSLTQPEKDNLAFDLRICRAIERNIVGETP